ncbi:MAG: hypothetical protein SGI92_18600 [Bryobacteraceae bacterium]|nr:hypothetical protein [Bryobacteraceae bacterium]
MSNWLRHIGILEWIAIIDGAADEAVKSAVKDHLACCTECEEFLDEIKAVRSKLLDSAFQVRVANTPGVEHSQRALEMALTELRKEKPAPASVEDRLAAVMAVITPICGAGGASRVAASARRRIGGSLHKVVPAERWPEFLQYVSSTTALLCGDTAAQMVWVAGME